MPRRDPKKRRPRATLAEAPAGDRKLEHGDDTPTPGTTQAACRIPTIQEPADPVLRAMYRLRGTDLAPLEQTGLFVLGRLLHNGKREIGAALIAALLRVSVASANNVLSALRVRKLIGSDGKYATERSARATRWLTPKGRRLLGLCSSSREHKDAHHPVSKRRSSYGELNSSSYREPDSGSDKWGVRPTPLRGTDPRKNKNRRRRPRTPPPMNPPFR